jgi:hypothetical protein
MKKRNGLVLGVAINDADYVTQKTVRIDGVKTVVWRCPFYMSWIGMLRRCYSQASLKKHPSYIGCSVCSEWLRFSAYKSWMVQQKWAGMAIDKDIIIAGNRVYSPSTCAFVSPALNNFILHDGPSAGVTRQSCSNKYRALCRNPITGTHEHIGQFADPADAHKAWRKRKHELACQLADLQDDVRVAAALRIRYA